MSFDSRKIVSYIFYIVVRGFRLPATQGRPRRPLEAKPMSRPQIFSPSGHLSRLCRTEVLRPQRASTAAIIRPCLQRMGRLRPATVAEKKIGRVE